MFGFNKVKQRPAGLPQALTEPENPVNYNSVLDYLVGLSKIEYDKMFKVSNIYRNANKDAAKVLGVKDEPTTQLKEEKPTEEEQDAAMDAVLNNDLGYENLDEPEAEAPKKVQAPEKKIDVNIG